MFAVVIMLSSIRIILSTFVLFILSALVLLTASLKANVESDLVIIPTNQLLPEGVFITQSLIDTEMPKLKKSQLGKILSGYYENCLGGLNTWGRIISFKVSAELNTANDVQAYESIYKKPNFYKIAISAEESTNIVAFDGNNKWQKQITEEEWSLPKIVSNMQRMIHEPELAAYLLYPLQEGKTFFYKGTVRENNTVCFKVELLINQGYMIEYFIDVESYHIVSIKITDTLEEFSPVLIKYSDHKLVDGVYFAHKIEYFLNEKWDSTLNIKEIITNPGVMNWMFYLNSNVL